MARKVVVVELCVRCPVGREKEATRTELLSLGDTRFQLRLCETHGEALVRDVFAWGRLGEQLEEAPKSSKFTSEYAETHRRAAELRAQQAEEDRAKERHPVGKKPPVTKGFPVTLRTLPHDAGEWIFTLHAQERLRERNITAVDALRAACEPSVVRHGRTTDTAIHENAEAKVVVKPSTKEILTVGFPQREQRKAQ
jgi:hypothetical protein